LIDGFGERILPVSSQTSILWGTLTAKAQEQGYILPVADGLIAATALNHNLTVVTRNVRDFAPAGVKMIDPWSV
jgi:predicted nucleic acid-binding protein